MKKKLKSKKTSLITKAEVDLETETTKKFSFGSVEVLSYDEIFGSVRGEMLKAFGQASNCGAMCDPYAVPNSDSRCAC